MEIPHFASGIILFVALCVFMSPVCFILYMTVLR
jgi:hypothetical protein